MKHYNEKTPPVAGEHLRGLIQVNIAVLLFSGTALFAKVIPLPVPYIIFGRSVVAATVLFAYARLTDAAIRPDNRRDLSILLGAGVLLGLHWLTYFQAVRVSTVAVGTIALHTYPIITVLVEPLTDRTRIRAVDVGLAAVVLVGVFILVGKSSFGSATGQGALWGISSAFLFTARNLIVRRSVQRYSGATIMFFQTGVTAVVLLPVPLVLGGGYAAIGAQWPLVLLLGTVFTALTQTLYAASLRTLSAKTVSIIATLLPLYAAVTAIVFLGEIPTVQTIIGGIVVIGAVMIETARAANASHGNQR